MKKMKLIFSFLELPLDMMAIILGFYVAYYYRIQTDYTYVWTINEYLKFTLYTVPAWVLLFSWMGLYSTKNSQVGWLGFSHILSSVSVGITLVIVWIFLSKTEFFSRLIVIYAWVSITFFVYLFRLLLKQLYYYFLKKGMGLKNILIVGKNEKSIKLARIFQNNYRYGFKVEKIIDSDAVSKIEDIIEKYKIDEVVITDEKLPEKKALKILNYCQIVGINFKMSPTLLKAKITALEFDIIESIPLLDLKRTPLDGWGKIIKRMLDIIISLVMIIVLSPIMLLVAIIIKITSPKGPVLFKQSRVGLRKNFNFIKFRSMHPDAEKLHQEYIKKYGNMFKLKNDPRVTKFGSFLRKTSLDELPQFITVLKGDMSIVGPRPPMPQEVELYSVKEKKRLGVKPGMTGLWQVSGRSNTSFDEWVRLDIFYIENWSLWLDISIMVKTLWTILGKRGAY